MDGDCPNLFNNVKGKSQARVITNLFADINAVDKMFDFEEPVDRTKKIAHVLSPKFLPPTSDLRPTTGFLTLNPGAALATDGSQAARRPALAVRSAW